MASARESAPHDSRPAAASRSELIRWMGVQDANSAGFVHGGTVMRICDEAAAIASIRHCGRRVVTGEVRHTSTAYLTVVGLDEDGKPSKVPPLTVEGPDQERRRREAEVRRRNRLAERDEIVADRDEGA